MTYYGAKELAASFRTVRANTIKVAEEIPEDKYSFEAAPGMRSVGHMLAHIALGYRFMEHVNRVEHRFNMDGFNFPAFIQQLIADVDQPRSKAELIELLKTEGEKWASWLETVDEAFLAERITFPNGDSRCRFDMLGSVKEHEMHHRGQLMLIERMLGITPHLTRESQARMAAMQAAMASQKQ
jgi:uncharacterized damage-inducible protein DinB